jgi:hypothetical protein
LGSRFDDRRVCFADGPNTECSTWCQYLSLGAYGTRKGTLLASVPLGVTTLTSPVVAPAGTVVVISVFETTWKTAAVP